MFRQGSAFALQNIRNVARRRGVAPMPKSQGEGQLSVKIRSKRGCSSVSTIRQQQQQNLAQMAAINAVAEQVSSLLLSPGAEASLGIGWDAGIEEEDDDGG
jgi:hypothetical protein